jgi:hypothetical protein
VSARQGLTEKGVGGEQSLGLIFRCLGPSDSDPKAEFKSFRHPLFYKERDKTTSIKEVNAEV